MIAKNVLNDFERDQVTVNWDELISCNTALCKYVCMLPWQRWLWVGLCSKL